MWIMIVITGFIFHNGHSSSPDVVSSPAITSVEFSSRERCLNAVKFTKQQPKIYNAFCVQK